jgi:hypothetical protein
MKTTPFGALLSVTGLSFAEAGAELGVQKNTIQDWARGKSRTPPDALAWARGLVDGMIAKSRTFVEQFDALVTEHRAPDQLEIAVSTDDYEARLNGFINTSHERATIGMIVAQIPSDIVRLVPRGGTLGTAAAERARLGDKTA